MPLRPRLLPAVILAASALLGVKVAVLWFAHTPSGLTAIAPALAQSGARASQPASPPQSPPAAPASAPADQPSAPAPDGSGSSPDPTLMSPAEIDILQQLSDRRAEIDKRAAALREQEVLLQATEQRIDEKIAKLQEIERSIGDDVNKQDDQDAARIKSLVRIYEDMKPKDAARIFEQLDMPVLVKVLEQMKELKVSPILANMDPAKARAVTMVLAEKHNQQQPGLTPASTPLPTAAAPRPPAP